MKYIAAIFVLWSLIYITSFAKYNMSRKNYTAAIGAVVLILMTAVTAVLGLLWA